MAEDGKSFRLRLLHEAVGVLGQEPSEQLACVGGASVDELGLAFDDGLGVVPTLRAEDGVQFSSRALELLDDIDRRLSAMSGGDQAELWTAEALSSDRRWHELRRLARLLTPELPVR